MLGAATRIQIQEELARVRASIKHARNGEAARLERQCEVVERYELRRESRESICNRLRISQRTFYLDRRSLLDHITARGTNAAAPERLAVASPLTARFQAVELLVQVAAYDLASARLAEIAANASAHNDKIVALGRLVQVECQAGRFNSARAALAAASERACLAGPQLSDRARGALLAAEASCAFSRGDAPTLEHIAKALDRLAHARVDDRPLWSQAATAWAQISYHHYLRYEIAASSEACGRSETALTRTGDARPSDRAVVLELRAEIDRHDPGRIHRAGDEDAGAYSVAVRHGMVESACVALHNTLIWLLNTDEPIDEGYAWLIKELALAACEFGSPSNGQKLTALGFASLGRIDDAITLLADCEYHQGSFDWSASHRMLQARLLFKAHRYAEAERAARASLLDWDRSGMAGQGKALRILAESLEALGQRRAAAKVVNEALEVLRDNSPVHHLLAAYRCAARVAPRRAYREAIEVLGHAMRRASSLARWAEVWVQSPRSGTNALTAREREIALLVADGGSNATIARQLGISAKTVANHLATIFDRLGLRARWQITRELLEHRAAGSVLGPLQSQ